MNTQDRIDSLIQAGWRVIESDFDERALSNWKLQAADCLKDLLGPDHIYTVHFEEYVRRNHLRDF